MKLWTIGHSTRPLPDFMALLRREQVTHLADVRRFPVSRRYPHFDGEALATALTACAIGYTHHPALGGRRTPRSDSPNGAWRNPGFRGYADHMETPEFRSALAELVSLGRQYRTAIMCAEAVPWRCHRSLIADALVALGAAVEHIVDAGTSAHALTSFAVVQDGRVSYPADARSQSNLFSR
jgi:uncharacterized protein (DUF488 family)